MSDCTAFCPLLPCTRAIHVILIGSSNTGISQEMCDLQRDVLIYECMTCHSIGIFYAHCLWCPVGTLPVYRYIYACYTPSHVNKKKKDRLKTGKKKTACKDET